MDSVGGIENMHREIRCSKSQRGMRGRSEKGCANPQTVPPWEWRKKRMMSEPARVETTPAACS